MSQIDEDEGYDDYPQSQAFPDEVDDADDIGSLLQEAAEAEKEQKAAEAEAKRKRKEKKKPAPAPAATKKKKKAMTASADRKSVV